MRVVEIFKSIEGEGLRAGLPATFVRLYGCNLNCSYCDTPYSHSSEYELAEEMSVNQIVRKISYIGVPSVTITGGEPMIQREFTDLVLALVGKGFYVNVETNGTMPIPQALRYAPTVMFTMDYKCPSSGMNEEMSIRNLDTLTQCDVLKFVVGSKEDMDDAKKVLSLIHSQPNVYFSPVFGKIEPKEIVQYLLDNSLYYCKVQIQMHKVIWNPDERGV